MTEEKAKQMIEEKGGDWNIFMTWMFGKTVGKDKYGSPSYYEWDIKLFINSMCIRSSEGLSTNELANRIRGHFEQKKNRMVFE